MNRTKRMLPTALGVFLGFAALASSARADVTNDYTAQGCQPSSHDDFGRFTKSAGTLTAKAGNTSDLVVVCPIVKTTSAPNVLNDQISQATVTQFSPTAGGVKCALNVYDSSIDFSGDGNLAVNNEEQSTVPNSSTFTIQGASTQLWWINPNVWYYAALVCTLKPGAQLNSYAISERGMNQTGYRIYSPGSCAPTSTSKFNYKASTSEPQGTGFWSVIESGGFEASCSLPASAPRAVQFSYGTVFGTTSNPNLEASSNGTQWFPLPKNSPVTEWPTRISAVAFPTGDQSLRFRRLGAGLGDPKVLSYRAFPLTAYARSGWGATAFQNSASANQAIDGNAASRWTSGTPQTNTPANSQWFQIDMLQPRPFIQIVMDTSGSANDYPRNYAIYASNSTGSWGSPIATGTGTSAVITVRLHQVTARFIKIVQTGTNSKWWSIHEVNVYSATP